MALPPIITGSPLFKVLTGSSPRSDSHAANTQEKESLRQDTVSVSDDALRKLEELKTRSSIKTDRDAREKAQEVRASLEENTDIVLGQK